MMQKLLVYCWGSLSEPPLCAGLEKLGVNYVKYAEPMKDYHGDGAFAQKFISFIHENKVEAVFSYDYFPLISMICEINKLPYISWIYDCPQYTLQSETLGSAYNYIFCFDRMYTERLQAQGAVNCFHFPLGSESASVERLFARCSENSQTAEKFRCDVSFVGNFYNDSKNRLRQAKLSPYATGYVEGLIRSQMLVYGYNFLRDSLPGNVAEEIVKKCALSLGKGYVQDDLQMAADALGMEVTAREREAVVKVLGETTNMVVYTSSKLSESLQSGSVLIKGYADYDNEVPLIFRESRINLNVTSRTIESGIPQRVFDILNCGGFCLTNYQPEVAQYFEDGQELVMYSSFEDLAWKVQYYLTHEEERAQIARNGKEKMRREFELALRLSEMLRTVEVTNK